MRHPTAKTQLFFQEMGQIVGSSHLAVLILTDENYRQAINVICDRAMAQQMTIRTKGQPAREMLLPEVLLQMLMHQGYLATDFELLVYDIQDGQYRAELTCLPTGHSVPIRASDAVLLSAISDIPLFIDHMLFLRQSSPYVPASSSMVLPINSINTEQLSQALQQAVNEENYRLAAMLQQEINKRTKS